MIAVQQFFCPFRARTGQIFVIKRLYGRVFVRKTKFRFFVEREQHIAARSRFFAVTAIYRLAAAACTAAGAGHDLDKFVVNLAPFDRTDQMARVRKTARHRAVNGRSCEVERSLAPRTALIFHRTHLAESICGRIFTGGEEVCGAECGLHNAAGRTEDNASA